MTSPIDFVRRPYNKVGTIAPHCDFYLFYYYIVFTYMIYRNLRYIQLVDIVESFIYLGPEIHTFGTSERKVYAVDLNCAKPISGCSAIEESSAPAFHLHQSLGCRQTRSQ